MFYKIPGLCYSSTSRSKTQSKVEELFHLKPEETSKQVKSIILNLMLNWAVGMVEGSYNGNYYFQMESEHGL